MTEGGASVATAALSLRSVALSHTAADSYVIRPAVK
jgi:hypothetical protein